MGEPVAEGDLVAVVLGVACGACYFCAVLREPGLCAQGAARAAGVHQTIVGGAPASRLELAEEFVADLTIDIEKVPDSAERIALVKEAMPGVYGPDALFECTGVPQSLPKSIRMLRRGGTYVESGHFTNAGDVTLNPHFHFVRNHITLVGVWVSSLSHFVRGGPILESGRYPFEKMVSHRLPLEGRGDAIQPLSTNHRLNKVEARKIAILAHPKES